MSESLRLPPLAKLQLLCAHVEELSAAAGRLLTWSDLEPVVELQQRKAVTLEAIEILLRELGNFRQERQAFVDRIERALLGELAAANAAGEAIRARLAAARQAELRLKHLRSSYAGPGLDLSNPGKMFDERG